MVKHHLKAFAAVVQTDKSTMIGKGTMTAEIGPGSNWWLVKQSMQSPLIEHIGYAALIDNDSFKKYLSNRTTKRQETALF